VFDKAKWMLRRSTQHDDDRAAWWQRDSKRLQRVVVRRETGTLSRFASRAHTALGDLTATTEFMSRAKVGAAQSELRLADSTDNPATARVALPKS